MLGGANVKYFDWLFNKNFDWLFNKIVCAIIEEMEFHKKGVGGVIVCDDVLCGVGLSLFTM